LLDYSRVSNDAVAANQPPNRFGPISEKLIRGFYESILSPGDAAVDVGVHYGVHLFGMRDCVGDSGLVYGVEANVQRYAAILKQLANRRMTNVHLLNVAAANVEGFTDFFVNRSFSGYSGLAENRKTPQDIIEKIQVYAEPLSSVIPRNLRPKFMKIDIERGEFPALLGARKMIEDAGTVIVFEGSLNQSATKFGLDTGQVDEYVRDIGYRVFDLFGNPIDITSWTGGFGWNYVAGPDNDATQGTIARALTDSWIKVLAQAD